MTTAQRKRVAIVILNKPNFEELGAKFLVLQLNRIQECFEFEFPEMDMYPLEKKEYADVGILLAEFSTMVKKKEIKADYFIGIVIGAIGKNWFWGVSEQFAIITTDVWKKYFVPPSVLEYIIHCITSVLILMSDKSEVIRSHPSTRGCCLDYTALKEEDRIDITLGYLCDECRLLIKEKVGANYLECFEKMHSMEWLGDVTEKGTVAYNLKKYLRIDLSKDTGFQKTRKEKAKEFAVGLFEDAARHSLSALFGGFIGFVLGWVLSKG
jgi:hypothetical protein